MTRRSNRLGRREGFENNPVLPFVSGLGARLTLSNVEVFGTD